MLIIKMKQGFSPLFFNFVFFLAVGRGMEMWEVETLKMWEFENCYMAALLNC